MNASLPKSLVALLLGLLLVSCTTNANTPRSPKPYLITDSSIAPNAYREPKVAARGDGGAFVGSIAAGVLGAAVGGAIDASVEAAKQREFEKRNRSFLVFEDAIDISRLTLALDELLSYRRQQSQAAEHHRGTIKPIIVKYGLFVSTDDRGREPVLEGTVAIKLQVRDSNGNVKDLGPYYGYSNAAYPISEYIENPELLAQVLEEAVSDAAPLVDQGIRSRL